MLRLDPGCCSFQIPKSASDKTCTFLEDASEGTLPHLKTADRIERSSTSRLFNPFEVCLLRERFSLKRCNFQAGKQRTLRWSLHEHVRAKMVLLTNIPFKFPRLKETVCWTRKPRSNQQDVCGHVCRVFVPSCPSARRAKLQARAPWLSKLAREEGEVTRNERGPVNTTSITNKPTDIGYPENSYSNTVGESSVYRKKGIWWLCLCAWAKSCEIAECFCKCMRAFLSPRGLALYHRTTSRLLHQKYVYTKYLWHETAFAPNNL